MEKTREGDMAIVKEQLGRRPKGAIGVASRCPSGHPQVVVTYPLRFRRGKLEVFPTLYWLSCPETVKAVARLEAEGFVGEMTERYGKGEEAEKLHRAHVEYAEERAGLLPRSVLDMVRKKYPGQYAVLTEAGVGGTRPNASGVKCLHTHLAHYLAGGENPVGEEVWGKLLRRGFQPCGTGNQGHGVCDV